MKQSMIILSVLMCLSIQADKYPHFDSSARLQIPAFITQALQGIHALLSSSNQTVAARVDSADDIPAQEKAFLQKRAAITTPALQNLLAQKPARTPTIAFCFSGGGFRAMIASLGFLKGAQEVGLLDATTYVGALSGSTWALASWISSGLSLDAFCTQLSGQLAPGLKMVQPHEFENLGYQLLEKALHHQSICAIDFYGALLAKTLLPAPLWQTATLAQTHAPVANGTLPFPVYTTISTNIEPYQWFECTPFELGSSGAKSYIPTSAFGRTFLNGISTKTAPEQTLGFMMGTFGSAFDINIEDFIRIEGKDMIEALALHLGAPINMVEDMFNECFNGSGPLSSLRFAPCNLPNFSYKLPVSLLHEHQFLTLVDAGINCNLPFAPLLRPARAVDLIIVYDSSGDNSDFSTLLCAQEYAKLHNLPFPPIDYSSLGNQLMYVFKDRHDSTCPVVIYFPLVKNEAYSPFDPQDCMQNSFCSTFNFKYTPEQFAQLSGLAEYTLKQQLPLILEEIAAKAL